MWAGHLSSECSLLDLDATSRTQPGPDYRMLLSCIWEAQKTPPKAAENAEAPGLIKVVINVCIQPFHLQRLYSH